MSKSQLHWAVAGFFIFYFIVLQFFNDWQYLKYINDGNIAETIRYRAITLPFIILVYYLFYKLIVPVLLNNRYLLFIFYVVLFFIFLELYGQIMNWVLWHAPFQTARTIKNAEYNWKHYKFPRQDFHFTFLNLFAVTGFAYFLHKWKQEKIIKDLKEQQLQMELNFLKMQIQPHFFFNTLNNIYTLTLQKSDKAAPLVAKHAEIMRYILYESSRELVTLKQEIDFLKNYTEVEKLHFSEKMDIGFDSQGIDKKAMVEPMLLLPFVENAFKHGIREETNKGYVHIIISLVENDLSVEIKNSKPKNINKNKEKGIGLQNAYKRLDMLYPGKHTVDIEETGADYELRLNLILKTHG